MNFDMHYTWAQGALCWMGASPAVAYLAAMYDELMDWCTSDRFSWDFPQKYGYTPPITQLNVGVAAGIYVTGEWQPGFDRLTRFHFGGLAALREGRPVQLGDVSFVDQRLVEGVIDAFPPDVQQATMSSMDLAKLVHLGRLLHLKGDESHAKFCGWRDDRNNNHKLRGNWKTKVKAFFRSASPAVGHAEFVTDPDDIGKVWYDQDGKLVHNRLRFVGIFTNLFESDEAEPLLWLAKSKSSKEMSTIVKGWYRGRYGVEMPTFEAPSFDSPEFKAFAQNVFRLDYGG